MERGTRAPRRKRSRAHAHQSPHGFTRDASDRSRRIPAQPPQASGESLGYSLRKPGRVSGGIRVPQFRPKNSHPSSGVPGVPGSHTSDFAVPIPGRVAFRSIARGCERVTRREDCSAFVVPSVRAVKVLPGPRDGRGRFRTVVAGRDRRGDRYVGRNDRAGQGRWSGRLERSGFLSGPACGVRSFGGRPFAAHCSRSPFPRSSFPGGVEFGSHSHRPVGERRSGPERFLRGACGALPGAVGDSRSHPPAVIGRTSVDSRCSRES